MVLRPGEVTNYIRSIRVIQAISQGYRNSKFDFDRFPVYERGTLIAPVRNARNDKSARPMPFLAAFETVSAGASTQLELNDGVTMRLKSAHFTLDRQIWNC